MSQIVPILLEKTKGYWELACVSSEMVKGEVQTFPNDYSCMVGGNDFLGICMLEDVPANKTQTEAIDERGVVESNGSN